MNQTQVQQQNQQVVKEVESIQYIDPQRFDDDCEMHSNSVYANTFYTVNNFDQENEEFDVSDVEQELPVEVVYSAINDEDEQELPVEDVYSAINDEDEQELPVEDVYSAINDEDEQELSADNENSSIHESFQQELPADNVNSSIRESDQQELPIYALPEPPELIAKPTKPQYYVLTSKASIAAKKKFLEEKQAAVIAREVEMATGRPDPGLPG